MKKCIYLFCLLSICVVLPVLAVTDKKDKTPKRWDTQSYCINGYTEEEARLLHDSRETDPIEGIWQDYNGERWSIERFTDKNIPERFKYRVVKVRTFWHGKPGMVDGFLELTADEGTFNMSVYRRFGKATYVSHVVSLLYRNRLRIEGGLWDSKLMKIYPTSEAETAKRVFSGSGSGFALSSDGYIATCDHLTREAKYIQVTGINGDFLHSYNAKLVLSDPMTDLAVIKIDDPAFETLGTVYYDLRNSTPVEGEPCYAMGYPQSKILGDNVKVTSGIISAVNAGIAGPVFCQISVPVTYGNSGGPLFDGDGNVLGVISAGYGDRAAYMANLAVKSSYLRLLLDSDPILRKLTFRSSDGVKRPLTEIISQVKNNVYLIKVSDIEPEVSDRPVIAKKTERSVPRPKFPDKGNRMSVLNNAKEKHRSGDYEGAMVILSEELQKDTVWAEAYYLRALCRSALGQQEEAIADYDAVLKNHKVGNTGYLLLEIYQNKSLCQAFVERYDEALKTIDLAIAENSSDVKNYEIRGCIYYYLENYQGCIEDLSRTIEGGNCTATVYYFRALAKSALKDMPGACSDMKQAASKGDKEAEEWLRQYE
ncbi:trypsin-like peptidase domain-containing protein [Coprobacter sp.]